MGHGQHHGRVGPKGQDVGGTTTKWVSGACMVKVAYVRVDGVAVDGPRSGW